MNVIAEIRSVKPEYTQEIFAPMVGISRSYLALLETGKKPVSGLQRNREARHILLSIAETIPASTRSDELQTWMDETAAEFEERPLGGVFFP